MLSLSEIPAAMKRRHFLKGVGAASTALAASPVLASKDLQDPPRLPDYRYGEIRSMNDVFNSEGQVMLRLETDRSLPELGRDPAKVLNIRNGERIRIRSWFLDRIFVLWLENASAETEIRFRGKRGGRFTLDELVSAGEIEAVAGKSQVKVNFLMDKEIGEIRLSDVGIPEPEENFSFVAMADPQGGYPDDQKGLKTRMKIHNAYIEESVQLANQLDFDPLFHMVIGDVCDDWGYEKDLAQMNRVLSRLRSPVLYGIGNHETLLRSTFEPGYDMNAFNHYLAAQKAMNGLDKLLYSFNAGRWHFIVWPDPLRDRFWETHPHYFHWLERDLEKYRDRPTMVFQHVPSHPIGIAPHINYAESVEVKRTFLDILARHGNVRVVLSGHVHIPVKASVKTAVSFKGIRMISLPAAGYRPRAFGEEDYFGGPSQGIGLVHIRGDKARIQLKTVTEELFDYPDELPPLDETSFPLWLKHPWELPAPKGFTNGNFKKGLQGWARRYLYMEDHDPSNRCEVRDAPGLPQSSALYLFNRRRGYMAPGQDRLPQDMNRVCQAVGITPGSTPSIRFRYRIDPEGYDPDSFSGGFIWIEGFAGREKTFNMMYSAGKIWVNIGGKYSLTREFPFIQMELPFDPGSWHLASLALAEDYNRAGREKSFGELQTDRLLVHLGVWHINDGKPQPFGILFTDLQIGEADETPSRVDGRAIGPKPKEDEWWRNKLWPSVNIAGEHRYIIATRDPEEL